MSSPGALPPTVVVLDTNVISELMRPAPEPAVVRWVTRLPPGVTSTSAVTLAELRFGVARLPKGRRRALLAQAADEVFDAFADRVLPFDAAAAREYAEVVVEREHRGAPISGFDAQIDAICRVHGAPLATRNVGDFRDLDLVLVNPWTAGG